MKTIIKGKDDLYYHVNISDSAGEVLLPSDLHTFTMQFFTSNNGDYIEYDKSDLLDSVLRVNASDLTDLADGPLRVRFLIGMDDSNYADNSFDITAERLTGYFLKTVKQQKQPAVIDTSVNNENDTEGGES